MMTKRFIIILFSLLFSFNLFAGKIEKGFRALEIYNYFDAKNLFEKALKRDAVAANYGLSLIYLRKDNPFFNLDSAYNTIVKSTANYSQTKVKKKLKYTALGIDSLKIFEQRDLVSDALFEQSKLLHKVASYQKFIDKNEWSKHIDSVIYYRDYLAYSYVKKTNTSIGYKEFFTKYPSSELNEEAKSAFDRLNYQENTTGNKFIDYVSFVENFPNSPYRPDAEDKVYQIYTKIGSLESYKKFIEKYPKNRNVPIAWKRMYNTYLQANYSSNSIQTFMDEFKDYPYKDELLAQLNRVDQILYPIKERNKWGYIDESGELYLKPLFEDAEDFYEGLAIIQLEGKYGFINKTGVIVIDPIFDDAYKMNEGHAVVELDEKWGLINRSGEFVIQPEYDDLGNLNEGLCYFSDGEKYGYFDEKGIIRLKLQYLSATDFKNGKAIVSNKAGYGLVDVFGTTAIPLKYDRLKEYTNAVYTAKFDGSWGLISVNGDSIIPFAYNFIGKMNGNRAIVEKDGLFNYIDIKGKEILENWIETYPEYRQLAVFNNDYAKIKFEKGYNIIDTLGKKIFSRDKEDIGKYGKYIAVKKGNKWGYLNRNGSTAIGYNYTVAYSFKTTLAKAGGAPLVGIINKKGIYQVEPYFEKIEFFNDTILITKSRGHYGILLTSGDTLLKFRYLSIEPFNNEVVLLTTKEAVFYYHLKKNKFIRKEEE